MRAHNGNFWGKFKAGLSFFEAKNSPASSPKFILVLHQLRNKKFTCFSIAKQRENQVKKLPKRLYADPKRVADIVLGSGHVPPLCALYNTYPLHPDPKR